MYNSFDNVPASRANGGHYRPLGIKITYIFYPLSIFPTSSPIYAFFFQLAYRSMYVTERIVKSFFLCKAQVNKTLEQIL